MPETIDCIRALTELERDGRESIRKTDAALGVTKTFLPAPARPVPHVAGENVEPVNLGSSELVTINQMADILEDIAGVKVPRRYKLDAPQGVRGRNSDNTLFRAIYGWEPSISLREGLEKTYAWIYDQLKARA